MVEINTFSKIALKVKEKFILKKTCRISEKFNTILFPIIMKMKHQLEMRVAYHQLYFRCYAVAFFENGWDRK